MNARVHEKVLVLFQESFNATSIFLQLRHFLLDVFQEVHVGLMKSKLPFVSSYGGGGASAGGQSVNGGDIDIHVMGDLTLTNYIVN